MAPCQRRTACIRLLAEIDQLIAECEDLASQPILADDEQEYLAVHLQLRRGSGSEWKRCYCLRAILASADVGRLDSRPGTSDAFVG